MIKKILCFMMLCMFGSKAFAMVDIYPIYVDFETGSRKKTQTVSVINSTDKPQTYQVSWKNYHNNTNAENNKTTEDFKSANEYLMFSPRQFTLKPGKTQNIRIVMKSMANAPDGEYLSYLHVSEKMLGLPEGEKKGNEEFGIGINLLMAAAIPVTIVKGDLQQETEIVDYKKNENKFEITLVRKGARTSHVNAILLDSSGKKIGILENLHVRFRDKPMKYTFFLDENEKLPAVIKLEDANTKKEILRKDISL